MNLTIRGLSPQQHCLQHHAKKFGPMTAEQALDRALTLEARVESRGPQGKPMTFDEKWAIRDLTEYAALLERVANGDTLN